ncbi:MAG: glycerol-3-phosphate 1-O-acyltransferase PlsY [Gammaproteobacteria bacterium]|nr:glycerol-3-phosphate 1-O-acyltransferase PlsY [Gammaproteobacteria bacterium]
MTYLYILPVIAYLLGSLSSAIIIARLTGIKDPREVGSGNPGATNILRYGGKKLAAITLLGDVLKGVIPVVLARLITADPLILSLVAGSAFLGHLFPVFFGFKGGKGVATALGVFLGLNPLLAASLMGTWLAMAVVFRYSSLSALVAAVMAPVYSWWLLPGNAYLAMSAMVAVLLVYRHKGNIQRLLKGEEDRIGSKKK